MIYVLSGGGGSGATLTVTSTGAGTVTVSNATLGKSYSKPVTAGGTVTFKGLKSGTWTVKLSNGTQTTTQAITINADYSMSVSYFSATISITYPAKSTCVVKNSSGTTVASNTNTGSSAKTWTATVSAAGTYTVIATATDGSGKTKSTTVSITATGQSKSVELNYLTYYYNKGDQCTEITGGWGKTGSGGSLTFNAASMILVANSYQNFTDASTSNKINLTDIKTLYFTLKSSTTYPTGYPKVGVSNQDNPSSAGSGVSQWIASKTLSASSEFAQVSLDVSGLTGSYYIVVGGFQGDSGGTTIEVEAVWGDYK